MNDCLLLKARHNDKRACKLAVFASFWSLFVLFIEATWVILCFGASINREWREEHYTLHYIKNTSTTPPYSEFSPEIIPSLCRSLPSPFFHIFLILFTLVVPPINPKPFHTIPYPFSHTNTTLEPDFRPSAAARRKEDFVDAPAVQVGSSRCFLSLDFNV